METLDPSGRYSSGLPIIYFFRESLAARMMSWILVFALLNLTGCRYYYKVTRPEGPFSETIETSIAEQKMIILIAGADVYQLYGAKINENQISGQVKPLEGYDRHLTTKPHGANRYLRNSKINESHILREVQIFVDQLDEPVDGKITFPLEQIRKIEMYDSHTGATIGSWILGAVGIAAGIYLLLGILVLMFKESCPFIYVYNGEDYVFTGEIYSGAIQPQLERHDYLRLPLLNPGPDLFQLKIANEIKEIQHTNLLELLVVDHPENLGVLADKYGQVHSFEKPVKPVSAVNLSGKDAMVFIEATDSLVYIGEDPFETRLTDGFILEFEKPLGAASAKLVIRARNTFLLDYNMNRFQHLFGDAYEGWQERQRNAPAERLVQWTLNQNIPLSVYVENGHEWMFVDYFNIVGPMAFKDDVLSIPLDFTSGDTFRVKLEFGAYFWELDYVGMDFSEDVALTQQVVPLNSAINQFGEDVGSLLSADDNLYYIQPEIGDEAVVTFALPPMANESRSIILHSKGHYQVIRDPSGRPDRQYLQSFYEPGQFNRFTIEYLQALSKAISE